MPQKLSVYTACMAMVLLAACGQKTDPFKACVDQKLAQAGQDVPQADALASAKKACLAAMPTVKEPTITGY